MISNVPTASRLRIYISGTLILFCMSALVATLYKLQVGRGAEYTREVRNQSTRTIFLPPARGLVADRWGVPLADLRPSIDIDIYLLEIKSHYIKQYRKLPYKTNQVRRSGVLKAEKEVDIVKVVETCIEPLRKALGDKINYDPQMLELHQRIRENIPFQLKSDLSFADISILVEKNPVVPGVNLSARPVRSNSYGATAAHIVGYVGRPDETKIIDRDGRKIEVETVGKDGVENGYDSFLQGNPGKRVVEVNHVGSVQRLIEQQYPSLGNTVCLTIDLRVQQIVEKAMAGVGRGAAVVLDVNSGDVLAMVSVPNYDPNTITTKAGWQDVSWNEAHPLFNRALGAYAPGSIFKIVVALAALKNDVINMKTTTTCDGGMWCVPNRFFKCWSFPSGGCGTRNILGGIKRSCNVFFYTAGIRTGITNVHKMATMLGLGQTSGLPLRGESTGVIPSVEWMKKNYPRDRWSNGHMANTSIGQGFVQVSPLQMAVVAATVANGGTVYYPRIVSKILHPNGEVLKEDPVLVRAKLDIPQQKMDIIREGMRQVVNDPEGTGKKAQIPNSAHLVAGKTGSAQFPTRIKGRNVKDTRTWFMAFAPFDKPRYSVCVMVEGGVSGGATSAPIVSKILSDIFDLENATLGYDLIYMQPIKGHFDGVQEIVEENERTGPVQGMAVPLPPSPDGLPRQEKPSAPSPERKESAPTPSRTTKPNSSTGTRGLH